MKNAIEARYNELRAEHERGTTMLAQMDKERDALAQTLHRIEGAVQVLGELLRADAAPAEAPVEGADNAVTH